MKPLLEPPEHTAEDALIWAHLNWRGGPRGGSLRWTLSLMQDRRDAELMSWLAQAGVRHYAGLDIPPAQRIPLVHLWVRGDPEWPAGHYLIELT